MAQFTVTINAKVNLPPSQIGLNTIYMDDPDLEYTITLDNITTETTPPYLDPEGDPPHEVKLSSIPIPARGVLTYNGIQVVENQIVPATGISSGLLKFQPVNNIGQYEELFDFDISDTGSNTFSGLTTGQLRMNVGLVRNEPPTIGDGSATMDYQGTLVFTRAMFTTDTVPAYSDPEGDAALQLKILSLPLEPGMKLNGVDVVVNQVIDFSDIDAGLFTYTNDDVMDTNGDIQNFTFAIADAGSGEFVE